MENVYKYDEIPDDWNKKCVFYSVRNQMMGPITTPWDKIPTDDEVLVEIRRLNHNYTIDGHFHSADGAEHYKEG